MTRSWPPPQLDDARLFSCRFECRGNGKGGYIMTAWPLPADVQRKAA